MAVARLYVRVLRACIALSLAALAAGLLGEAVGVHLLWYAAWVVVASPYVALAALALEYRGRDRRVVAEVLVILLLALLDLALALGVGVAGA